MKKGEQIKQTINGTEYTFQFNGLREVDRARERCLVNGEISNEKFRDYIFENVVIDPPHINYDEHFESMEDLEKVCEVATTVMTGNFRSPLNNSKTTSKK